MNSDVPQRQQPDQSRRDVIRSLAAMGTGLFVIGCTSARRPGPLIGGGIPTPAPVWPDQEAGGDRMVPIPPDPRRQVHVASPPIPQGVLPRTAWTHAGPNPSLADPMGPVWRITVHHDALNAEGIRNERDAAMRLENERRQHVQKGWADLGYHFVIDPGGRVWQGRPLSLQGAHVRDNNPGNVGIMLMGNFNEHRPTPAQIDSLDAFVAAQARFFRVPLARILTHQEINPTQCPGTNLQRYMRQTRARGGRVYASLA